MKKCTILFDLDGTLIDSTEAILESFHHALRRCSNVQVEDEDIVKLIGHPLDFMFAHIGVKSGIEQCVAAYKEHYHSIFTKKTKLLPDAKEAILQAHSFANLAIVTTKTGKYSKELMAFFGLENYFSCIIGREDVIHPKPHPEPLIKAIKKIDALKEYTWMVGDTCLDMDAAKRAGISCVGVTCGYATDRQLQRCSTHIASTALEAVELIQKTCT
ncbi:HAD family hydrolase [Nitratiruptor sp. SB155-2]|uniref:HAD family hydrolase n=1 Tax=Nitratiruptor sp. (strain SB155-2) TaxID=387092 RepID=UPI00015872E4|nr:HAD family hydrolase [Nitratiruptor sp. SB155-2]BAF70712.1 HAD-superfamily hydrolase [Nitratiruptor sp. SB155-2]